MRVVDPNSPWGRVAHFFQLPPAPHLVLLDTGMVATLTPGDQRNLVQFFKARARWKREGWKMLGLTQLRGLATPSIRHPMPWHGY